jgi:hypothetical protein
MTKENNATQLVQCLVRESNSKLTGYAKLKLSKAGLGGRDLEVVKSCAATLAADSSRYVWECH